MAERPITEVFALLCDLGVSQGASNIKDLPGCWTYESGKDFIAINGHGKVAEVQAPDGGPIKVPPYAAVMLSNGWLVYTGNAYNGASMMMTETELIQRIQKLIDQKSVTA